MRTQCRIHPNIVIAKDKYVVNLAAVRAGIVREFVEPGFGERAELDDFSPIGDIAGNCYRINADSVEMLDGFLPLPQFLSS